MIHFMLDLETLSTRRDAAIAQIGVTEFDPFTDRIGPGRCYNISLADAVQHGRVDGETLGWWFQQKPEVIASVFGPSRCGLKDALLDLADFLHRQGPRYANHTTGEEFVVWADPSEFDHSIVVEACDRLGITWPWPRRATRDMRTFKELAWAIVPKGDLPKDVGVGTHNALSDAIWQVKVMQGINRQLRTAHEVSLRATERVTRSAALAELDPKCKVGYESGKCGLYDCPRHGAWQNPLGIDA